MNAAAGRAGDFPWDQLMAAGFGLLRLSPRAFWSMTPRELAHALAPYGPGRTGGPGRDDLAAMMRRYPDKARGDGHG